MKCKKIGFNGCLCATCVLNPNYALNTPKPCIMADCDLCEDGDCSDYCTYFCSGHLTIEDINAQLQKGDC